VKEEKLPQRRSRAIRRRQWDKERTGIKGNGSKKKDPGRSTKHAVARWHRASSKT